MIYLVIIREISAEMITNPANTIIIPKIYCERVKSITYDIPAPNNKNPPHTYSVRNALRDLHTLYNTLSSVLILIFNQ